MEDQRTIHLRLLKNTIIKFLTGLAKKTKVFMMRLTKECYWPKVNTSEF